jgi:hypothetical protein
MAKPPKPSRVPPAWIARPGMKVRNLIGRAHARAVPPPLLVMERMNGMVEARAIAFVAELGVADLLADGPRTAEELAKETGVDADALGRTIGLLISRGFFSNAGGGRFTNNAVSDALRSDHPESMRDWARFFGSDWHWKMWQYARHSLDTGEGAARQAFGTPFFDYLTKENPSAGEVFDRAMAGGSRMQGPMLARGYDFSNVRRLCDVGGGTGGMLAAVLGAFPNVRGVLFDLPEVAERGRAAMAERGLGDRVEVVGGSFFDSVPAGCDAYMLQAIVHDWDDESCVLFLSNIRKAMTPDARVLVIEQVLQPEPEPIDQFARSFDLVMLVTTGAGRERSRAQFDALFARAGLRVERDVMLPSMFHVLELKAVK